MAARWQQRGGTCVILAIDPGETTGIAVVGLDVRWLRGQQPATWEGIRKAITFRYAAEIGRHPRMLDGETGRSRAVDGRVLEQAHIPVVRQPLEFEEDRGEDNFFRILGGEGRSGGGDITTLDYGEMRQLRQIAGLLELHPSAAIVIEGFTPKLNNRDRGWLAPDRLRTAIMFNEIVHGSRGRLPFTQQPSYAMTTANNERLKRAGLHLPGMVHGTDAMRHLATFARDARADIEVRAAAWPRFFRKELESDD